MPRTSAQGTCQVITHPQTVQGVDQVLVSFARLPELNGKVAELFDVYNLIVCIVMTRDVWV